jgi:putative salt-induced outer membrane protein YdiY
MSFSLPKYILSFIFFATAAYAEESFVADLSGSFIQGSGAVTNGTFQYDGVETDWQQHYTGDFLFKSIKSQSIHTNADFGAKLDYKLANTYYLQAGTRGEYDNLRDDLYSITNEIGGGYKFIHTKKIKLSDELGLGLHSDRFSSSSIISNSVWFTYCITENLTFNDKFLIERGWKKSYLEDTRYTSNITIFTYKLTPKVDLTIQQKYKREKTSNINVTLIGLALHF